MGMVLRVKGFDEAIAKLKGIEKAPQSRQFQRVLLDAADVIRKAAIANVHSVTGRTVSAIVIAPGAGANPSAYVKLDKRLASLIWRGRRFPYPYAVEAGHGGPHPAAAHPFFGPAVIANRSKVRRMIKDGIEDVLHPYVTSLSVGGEFS